MFVAARCPQWWLLGWLAMENNQMSLPESENDVISQAEAYTMAGISRAILRGCIDRGELRIADHLGSRGSVRLYRSDVARLMAERRWPGAAAASAQPAPADGGECGQCTAMRMEVRSLHEARQRDADTMQRLRDALMAATR